MVKNKLGRNVLICLVLFLGGLATVYAQGPDGEEEPVSIAPAGRLNLTFEQFGYDTKRLDRTNHDRMYSIIIPGNFQIAPTGNYLDLITHHFPAIPDKPSVLSVEVNGRLLSAFALTESNAISNTVRITLPQGLLRTGFNPIRIDLDTRATCEDPGAIVDVSIDANSSLSFGYQQNPYPTDLSLYPLPFTEPSLLKIPVALILPDSPTPDDLSAGATVAAGLGQMSRGSVELVTVLASELDPDIQNNYHLIVIGQPDDNALLNELALPMPIDDTTLYPGQGMLEEIVSPWNEFRLVLVVSGLDDEGVSKASQALNQQAHFLSMRGPVARVAQMRTASTSVAPRAPSMTLAALGYEDVIVYGAAPQEFTFYFALPTGWQLEASPSLVLRLSHADLLDPRASAVDISLNRVPIGGARLDESNAIEGELTIPLPKRLLKAGNNRLQLGIEMNFPVDSRDKCNDLADERAWTVISNESEISISYETIDPRPDLSLFPYPFSQSDGLDQTLLVLPDQPSSSILNDLIQLAVQLGSASPTERISAHVTYAAEVDSRAQQSYHLILLGRPTENTLLREANAYLPQPFAPDSDVLEPLAVENVAFVPDPERDAGLLEIIASPWNAQYSLLVISGTTDQGVQMAIRTLLEQPQELKGDLAVVEPTFLADESDQLGTYAVDTRPPVTIDEETSADDTAAENELVPMAERWWK